MPAERVLAWLGSLSILPTLLPLALLVSWFGRLSQRSDGDAPKSFLKQLVGWVVVPLIVLLFSATLLLSLPYAFLVGSLDRLGLINLDIPDSVTVRRLLAPPGRPSGVLFEIVCEPARQPSAFLWLAALLNAISQNNSETEADLWHYQLVSQQLKHTGLSCQLAVERLRAAFESDDEWSRAETRWLVLGASASTPEERNQLMELLIEALDLFGEDEGHSSAQVLESSGSNMVFALVSQHDHGKFQLTAELVGEDERVQSTIETYRNGVATIATDGWNIEDDL